MEDSMSGPFAPTLSHNLSEFAQKDRNCIIPPNSNVSEDKTGVYSFQNETETTMGKATSVQITPRFRNEISELENSNQDFIPIQKVDNSADDFELIKAQQEKRLKYMICKSLAISLDLDINIPNKTLKNTNENVGL